MIEFILIAIVIFTIYAIVSGNSWTRTVDTWVGPHRVFVDENSRGRIRVVLFINGNPVRQVHREAPAGHTAQEVIDSIVAGL